MTREIENYGRQRLLTAKTWAALLVIIFCVQIEVAVAQNAPSTSQKLTLARAVDLALKQNLDIQIANIDSVSNQQKRVIARSELRPKAGFDASDASTRYNTKARHGGQPAIIPPDVGPYDAIHVGRTFSP